MVAVAASTTIIVGTVADNGTNVATAAMIGVMIAATIVATTAARLLVR
jgi:hypothetical protein